MYDTIPHLITKYKMKFCMNTLRYFRSMSFLYYGSLIETETTA